MRTFLQLLPFRIEQALSPISLRSLRSQYMRRKYASDDKLVLPKKHRFFIDVAVISKHNAGTGIQRVVDALASALIAAPQDHWDLRFVSARRKRRYFVIEFPSLDSEQKPGEEMKAEPGDVFLGLDYSLDAVRQHRGQLRRFRRNGGAVWFLVHDLLPLNRPEWFSRNTVIRYRAWLGVLASVADGFFCNSAETEKELRQALADGFGLIDGYRCQVLPMGYDIPVQAENSLVQSAMPVRFDLSVPFALMVGTVEPRKGHGDIITAFEELWKRGRDERLVIVGRRGWNVEGLERRIETHPELNKRLFWFDDVEDQELVTIYDACDGVIIGSYGEGFGLPLIEALGRNKPVLARDLPVFRTHDGSGVWFFAADATPTALADSIHNWQSAARRGEIPVRLPPQSWTESGRILLLTLDVHSNFIERKMDPSLDRQSLTCVS